MPFGHRQSYREPCPASSAPNRPENGPGAYDRETYTNGHADLQRQDTIYAQSDSREQPQHSPQQSGPQDGTEYSEDLHVSKLRVAALRLGLKLRATRPAAQGVGAPGGGGEGA